MQYFVWLTNCAQKHTECSVSAYVIRANSQNFLAAPLGIAIRFPVRVATDPALDTSLNGHAHPLMHDRQQRGHLAAGQQRMTIKRVGFAAIACDIGRWY